MKELQAHISKIAPFMYCIIYFTVHSVPIRRLAFRHLDFRFSHLIKNKGLMEGRTFKSRIQRYGKK